MILRKEEKVLLILLKSGLWEKVPEDLSLFPLSEREWDALFALARKQTVTGLVYRGLIRLPDTYLPAPTQLFRWVAQVDAIERNNKKMNHTLAAFYSLVDQRNFSAILQKGQGVATLYEQPLLRECGDIDLYVPSREERKEIFRFFEKENCPPVIQPDGSSHLHWKGIEFEFHTGLFDFRNPFLKKRLVKLIEKHGFSEVEIRDGETPFRVKVPAPLLTILLLNIHILKHAIGVGIGLRQLCDMARAYHVLHSEIDPEELQIVYQKTGIAKWSRLLHSFLTDFLALDPEFIPGFAYDQKVSSVSLFQIILQGGNFGQHTVAYRHAAQHPWRRKLHTLQGFYKSRNFGLQYAPMEVFWIVGNLFWGQLRLK